MRAQARSRPSARVRGGASRRVLTSLSTQGRYRHGERSPRSCPPTAPSLSSARPLVQVGSRGHLPFHRLLQFLDPARVLRVGQRAAEVVALPLKRNALGLQISERLLRLSVMDRPGGIPGDGKPLGSLHECESMARMGITPSTTGLGSHDQRRRPVAMLLQSALDGRQTDARPSCDRRVAQKAVEGLR